MLLVVAIEQVSTMQLLVWEAIVWLTIREAFPQTAPTDDAEILTSELHNACTLETEPAQHKS